MLIPDILESILIAKDAESNSLRLQLQDLESKLMIHSYEKNIDTNNLQMQLEEKCQKIEQLEGKLNCLEKVCMTYLNICFIFYALHIFIHTFFH